MSNSLGAVVHLVDDDPILLDVLVDLVASIGVGTVAHGSPRQFLESYRPVPCECVVSDIRMPEMTGLELQRALNERHSVPPAIIFVTGFAEVSAAVEAMKKGAFDFVEKPVSATVFLEKINLALLHSRDLHTQRLDTAAHSARLALLTPKEQEILRLLMARQTSREIAEVLNISVRTAENHRAHILTKLRAKDTFELLGLFSS